MKHTKTLLILSLLFTALAGNSQSDSRFISNWEGKLNLGVELRIVFHIKDNGNGVLIATADSPDQAAYGLKCDTVVVKGDSVRIEMKNLSASVTGKLITDSTIQGIFTQASSVPLVLKKSTGVTAQRKRPQTPKPPFPYKSEDVEYDNTNKSLHYGATITIPNGNGPFPAVVLITGSGQQDRDESILGHKMFAVLADALTKDGLIVLRVDDRGAGKSTGKFIESTSADFVNDVNTSLDYLRSRPEADKKKLGLLGHSEGGMIAPMVAAGRKDIDFIILLAGPGIKIDELMAEQNAAILGTTGIDRKAIDAYIPLYKNMMNAIITSSDSVKTFAALSDLVHKWSVSTDTLLQLQIGVLGPEQQMALMQNLYKGFSGKWFKYFLAFDPQPYLQKLHCKVLALNGSRDIQVIPASNLAGIQAALKKSTSKNYTVKEIPDLNHLFQTCTKCNLAEYGELEETFSLVALKEITDWLDKNVK